MGNVWKLGEWVPDLLVMIRSVDLEAVLIGEIVGGCADGKGCAEAVLTIDDVSGPLCHLVRSLQTERYSTENTLYLCLTPEGKLYPSL